MGEGTSFLQKAQHVERIQGKGGIAEPSEAIVPVAHPTETLRERGRWGSDKGTCRSVGEHFECEGTALYPLGIWSPVAATFNPPAPGVKSMSQLPVKVTLWQFMFYEPASGLSAAAHA